MLSDLVQEIATRIEARESRTRSRTASNQNRIQHYVWISG